MNNEKIVIMAI